MEYTTNKVIIYDVKGNIVDEVRLPERIMAVPAKRTGISESGLYYKGSGIVYQKHLVNEISSDVNLIGNSGIIYEKYVVTYPNLIGKYGIFNFPHQPMFDDMEGACGTKENKIVENVNRFELSAIDEIVNVIDTRINNSGIYVYKLKKVNASPDDITDLIEYVLANDYNTAWDKNLWSDVYCYKYIRDVADWFVSEQENHKLGTVYALLNSLYASDIYLYLQLIYKIFGSCNANKQYVIYYSGLIVNRFCKDKLNVDLGKYNHETKDILLKLLFSGKACCHLADDKGWEWVREYYLNSIRKSSSDINLV